MAQDEDRMSALRAHGRRVPGDAFVPTSCSTGRGADCSTGAVWLSFHDAEGLPTGSATEGTGAGEVPGAVSRHRALHAPATGAPEEAGRWPVCAV
ncbi:hypothetical protein ABT187_14485 [Streptomyces sp. NPDC001817]|uniref:hypothetical protein n=1 Tax=Streptomyces sp. NPDC001817 TaxID=3154398 RepID=UPI0033212AD4